MEIKRIKTPLEANVIEQLRAGEKVFLTGYIYTARDAAHKRFIEALTEGSKLPFDIQDQVIYYCGPSPAPPAGLLAHASYYSSRMDAYAPRLISLGLKGMIGKGNDHIQSRTRLSSIKQFILAQPEELELYFQKV